MTDARLDEITQLIKLALPTGSITNEYVDELIAELERLREKDKWFEGVRKLTAESDSRG